ncbi:MAG: ABC transporter permease [Pirellulales bacterium]|nr:ABC transporter permease [Pirellulales bacterium]
MLLPSFRIWRLGVKSLALHPLRSLLTVLGVFVGTSSVIWLLAIGEGISRKAQEQIEELGANNVIVRTAKPPADSTSSGAFFYAYGLTRDDWEKLTTTIETIDRSLPIREIPRKFSYDSREIPAGRLVGCTPDYADVMHLNMARGRFLEDIDLARRENVCVLAHETARQLFPIEEALGKEVRVEDEYYRVVGVTEERTPSAGIGGSLSAQDFNLDLYIPIDTLWDRVGDMVMISTTGSRDGEIVELNQITLRVNSIDQVAPTAALVRHTLEADHRKKDYAIVVPLELLEQAKNMRIMFMLLLGLIAAISLVVGGIGIMNIMLATVTERTREVGIRRALGAKRQDITRQFLVETVVLSVVGGATGILGGLLCGPLTELLRWTVTQFSPEMLLGLPEVVRTVTPQIVPWSIPLAFGISVGVGVVFGLYPAMRAAKMDPIEALRHE